MSSITSSSSAQMSTFIVTFTTFACVLSTFRRITSIDQAIPLTVGGVAATTTTQVIAFKFFKAIHSQKDSLVVSYLKSPSFTVTLASLIVENRAILSFERIGRIGLVILGVYMANEAASLVPSFISRERPQLSVPEEVVKAYTPLSTAVDYQKGFAIQGLSGQLQVKMGNEYVLNDEEVKQALNDQWQRVRIASERYKALEKHFPYDSFTLKTAPRQAKIAENISWGVCIPGGYPFKSRSIEACGLKAGICEAIGCSRDEMEDCTLATEIEIGGIKLPVFGVFDGHGSSDEAAGYVETHFPTTLKEKLEFFLSTSGSTELTDTVMYNALKSALITLDAKYQGAGGTTVNIVIAWNEHLYTANIGDSRSIAINEKTGAVQVLSEDALPNDPRHKQIIKALGGFVELVDGVWRTSSTHAMGSAFGNPSAKKVMNPTVDITKNPMIPGSIVVIASDGVWDTAPSFGLGKALGNRLFSFRTSEQAIAEDVVYSSLMNHSNDNLSAVVIRIPPAKGSGWFEFR